jgi:parallel beta-helix repeat protein
MLELSGPKIFMDTMESPTYYLCDYFVDATGGSDSNDGESQAEPIKTITELETITLVAGDTVCFKRGETWTDQLTVGYSGTSGNPITFGAYGVGDKPIISAEAAISGTNKDYITIQDIEIQGWDYQGIVNTSGDGWTLSRITISGGRTATGWTPPGDADIRGIDIVGAFGATVNGFVMEDSTIGTISDAAIDDNRASAVHLFYVQNAVVRDNSFNTNNYVRCILAQDDFGIGEVPAPTIQVTDNTFYQCNSSVLLRGQPEASILRNTINGGTGTGIGVWMSDDVTLAYNLIYDLAANTAKTSFNGIDINGGSEDGFAYNNTVYAVENANITLEDVAGYDSSVVDGWTLKNNIFDASANTQVNIAAPNDRRVPIFISDGVSSWASDFNQLFPYSTGPPAWGADIVAAIEVAGGGLATATLHDLAGWRVLGYGTYSDDADPIFAVAGSDFTLAPGSPAVDAGTDVGLTEDILGNPIVGDPDMGAYEYQGTDYYVDATEGDNGNEGTSPSEAWETIAKLETQTLSPGDNVYFQRGETWREQLDPAYSGVTGNEITFGAYGTGDAPIITAADTSLGDTWTYNGGSQADTWYLSSIDIDISGARATFVSFDGTAGTEETSVGNLNTLLEWYYDDGADRLYVYATANPNTVWTDTGVEYGIRDHAIRIDSKSYLKFENLQLEHGVQFGGIVRILNTSDFDVFDNLVVRNSAQDGILFNQTNGAGHTVSDSTFSYVKNGIVHHAVGGDSVSKPYLFSNNAISNCTRAGISIGADYGVAEYNTITDCGITDDADVDVSAIHIHDADDEDQGSYWDIRYNTISGQVSDVTGNDGGGIISDTGTTNNDIYYNLVSGCQGYGIALYDNAGTHTVYNNTFYKNNQVTGGNVGEIYVGAITGPVTIKNNIAFSDGALSNRYALNVATDSIGNTTVDYNLHYRDDTGNWWVWGGSAGDTLSGLQSANSQSVSSDNADPLFVTAGSDFEIQVTSPALDNGVGVTLTEDIRGYAIVDEPEMGAYEYDGDFYVDAATGSDSDDGRTAATAYLTLGKAEGVMKPVLAGGNDALLNIAAGTYREDLFDDSAGTSLNNDAELEIVGSGSVIIKGSILTTAGNWSLETGKCGTCYSHAWTNDWGLAENPNPGYITDDIILRREMVFVDGVLYRQYLDTADFEVIERTFWVDEDNDKIFIHLPFAPGKAPADYTDPGIEVADLSQAFQSKDGENIVLNNLTFQHFSDGFATGSTVLLLGASNILVTDCTFEWNNYSGLTAGAYPDPSVCPAVTTVSNITLNNITSNNNGLMGLGMNNCDVCTFTNVESSYNNWRGHWGEYYDWSLPNKYARMRDTTFTNYTAVDNYGAGLWFDYDNQNIVVDGCLIEGNGIDLAGDPDNEWERAYALYIEANPGPIFISNCVIRDNYLPGVMVANSADVTLHDNEIYDNHVDTDQGWGDHSQVMVSGAPDPGRSVCDRDTGASANVKTDNLTFTNNIVEGDSRYLLAPILNEESWNNVLDTLTSDYNDWRSDHTDVFCPYSPAVQCYELSGTRITLGDWRTGTDEDLNSTFTTGDLDIVYYVDATGGSDWNNGLMQTKPWQTIAKVEGTTLSPGDSVLFNRGDTWREDLEVPSSGADGNPITFGAYGTGANPTISGAALVTTWSNHSGEVWKAALATEPDSVWLDGTLGTNEPILVNVDAANEWHWVGNELYVYSSAGDPDTEVTNPGIEVRDLDRIFRSHDKSYITVQDLTFTKGFGDTDAMVVFDGIGSGGDGLTIKDSVISDAEGKHLQFRGTADGVIQDNTVTSSFPPDTNGTFGIMQAIYGVGTTWNSDDITISGNTVYGLQYGIALYYATGAEVFNNTIYDMTAAGLSLMLSPGTNNVYGNTIYDVCQTEDDTNAIQIGTGDVTPDTAANVYQNTIYGVDKDTLSGSGIMLDLTSQNCNVYQNRIFDAEGGGIHVLQSSGHTIYYNVISDVGNQVDSPAGASGITLAGAANTSVLNNVVYDPGEYALHLIRTVTGLGALNIKNNIFYGSTTHAIRLDDDSGIGSQDYDYNTWYFTAGKMADWSGTEYDALSNWQSGESQDSFSIDDDPLFTAPGSEFTLQDPASPAIDNGTPVGLTEDFIGNPMVNDPDMGAYETQ